MLHRRGACLAQGPSHGDFLSDFEAKAVAAELPKGKWVANAMAAMGPVPRSYCQKAFAQLAEEADEPDREVQWADLVKAVKAGPWAQKATAFALR